MTRFTLYFRSSIEQAPLQVYSSALMFAPMKSLVRGQFEETVQPWIDIVPPTSKDQRSVEEDSLAKYHPDGEVRIRLRSLSWMDEQWDACLCTLDGHKDEVKLVKFSPIDDLLVSASSDRTVRLWNTRTGKLQYVFEGHTDGVNTVDFSADGKVLASGADDCRICVWNVATGDVGLVLNGHRDSVKQVLFITDGEYLASRSTDGTIRIWDLCTGATTKILGVHESSIRALTSCLRFFASGADDGTVLLWDQHTHNLVHSFKGHRRSITSLTFSPDGKLLCSTSQDDTLRLWSVEKREEIHVFREHTGTAFGVTFSPDGQFLVSCSRDNSVRVWDVRNFTHSTIHEMSVYRVRAVVFSPDGRYIISGSDTGTICVFDLISKHTHLTFDNYGSRIWALTMSTDGRTLASGSWSMIRLWDMQLHEIPSITREHRASVDKLLLLPNHKLVASSSLDGSIRLWDIKTPVCIERFENVRRRLRLLGFSPDADRLLFTRRLDVDAQERDRSPVGSLHVDSGEVMQLSGYKDRLESTTFLPDGQFLASRSYDETSHV